MVAWIFESEDYTEAYHEYFAEFIEKYFDSGYFEQLVDYMAELIAPYVEKDPSKFCTYEEFETGVETIKQFCLLRAESVSGQLEGSIPSTSEGQSASSSTLVDASSITISDMGTMSMGADSMGNRGQRFDASELSAGMEFSEGMEMPEGMEFSEGMEMPDMTGMPGGEMPSMPDMSGTTEGEAEGAIGDFSELEEGRGQQQMQRPSMGDMSGQFQFGDGTTVPGTTDMAADISSYILLGVTLVVLAAGLLVAFKFKR